MFNWSTSRAVAAPTAQSIAVRLIQVDSRALREGVRRFESSISENFLQNNENNFLGSAVFHNDKIGLAFLDYSTGEFICGEWVVSQAENIINRYSINEIIICENQVELIKPIIENQNILLTEISDYLIDIDTAYETLINHFNTKSLKGFGIENMETGICAAGSAFSYIENNYIHIVK